MTRPSAILCAISAIGGLIVGLALPRQVMRLSSETVAAPTVRTGAALRYSTKRGDYLKSIVSFTRSGRSAAERIKMLGVLELWLQQDPIDCVNALYASGHSGLLEPLVLEDFSNYGDFVAIADPDLRDAVIEREVVKRCETEPLPALDLLGHVPLHLRARLGAAIAEAVARKQGLAGIDRLFEHQSTTLDMIRRALTEVAGERSSDVLGYLESLDEQKVRKYGNTKEQLLQWIQHAVPPEVMLAYLETSPMSSTRTEMRINALARYASAQPNAWKELLPHIESGPHGGEIAVRAAATIALSSLEAASEFLAHVPGELRRATAARSTVRALLRKDRHNVNRILEWLRNERDPGVVRGVVAELNDRGIPLPPDLRVLEGIGPGEYKGEHAQ